MRRLHLKTPISVLPAVTDSAFFIPITITDRVTITKTTTVFEKDTRANTLPNIPFTSAISENTVSEVITP
jgi:hypothetical protein